MMIFQKKNHEESFQKSFQEKLIDVNHEKAALKLFVNPLHPATMHNKML